MRLPWMLALCGWCLNVVGAAANTAEMRLFCLSVRVFPATTSAGGLEHRQDYASAHFDPPNGEWFPVFEDDLTHATIFRLQSPVFPEALLGEMAVLAPEDLDSNTNGIPDFYEVRVELPATTTLGLWLSDVARGDVRTVWRRPAGERFGTVTVQFSSREYGELPEFSHRFEILEHEGTMTYTPGDPFRAEAILNRVGTDSGRLAGPWLFSRQPTNRLNQLVIGESSLTNEMGEVLSISLGDIEADPDYTMDYFGAVAFVDGDPSSPEMDFELYYMGINDPQDADADGVPDLTDDIGDPPLPPSIEIVSEGGGVRLRLRGAPGFTYSLMRTSELDPEGWSVDRKVTLSSPEQEILIPAVSGSGAFWQVRWP